MPCFVAAALVDWKAELYARALEYAVFWSSDSVFRLKSSLDLYQPMEKEFTVKYTISMMVIHSDNICKHNLKVSSKNQNCKQINVKYTFNMFACNERL